MSIFKQVYSDKYVSIMGDDNSVLSKFTDLNPYILGDGQTLRIPQLTYKPTVLKGLTSNNSFDTVTVSEGEQLLAMERYYIQGIEVGNYEKMYEAYDKIGGVAGNLALTVADDITYDVLINMARQIDSDKFLPTTGTLGVANSPSGANKKMIKLIDVAEIATKMDKDKVAKNDRYLLVSPTQWKELKYSSDNIQYSRNDFGMENLANGIVGNIAGIDIMVRADIPVYNGSSGIKDRDVAFTSTDVFNAIAWQKDHLGYAMGNMDIRIEYNQLKYANILTFENYMLAGSVRQAGARIGLYGLRQG